jgi:hypothetical protein
MLDASDGQHRSTALSIDDDVDLSAHGIGRVDHETCVDAEVRWHHAFKEGANCRLSCSTRFARMIDLLREIERVGNLPGQRAEDRLQLAGHRPRP